MALNTDHNLVDVPDAIFTFSGGMIRPLDPNPDDINLFDIAHALSMQCRFTGHSRDFYSVGEHSIHCAEIVGAARQTIPKFVAREQATEVDLRLTALLHDASEAYLCDIARPVKHAPLFKAFYIDAERRLERAIAERFGLIWPWPEEVKVADDGMLDSEISVLMPEALSAQWPRPPVWAKQPECWKPEIAETIFITKFIEYGGSFD